jgi:hypothetical protein
MEDHAEEWPSSVLFVQQKFFELCMERLQWDRTVLTSESMSFGDNEIPIILPALISGSHCKAFPDKQLLAP